MKTKHILLIDDNDIDNYVNRQLLIRNQAADIITVIDSAEESLEYLDELIEKAQPFPGIIFLDINMPSMDGFGFLKKYEEFPEEKKETCCIVMLTSSENPNDMELARKNRHVMKYLLKPLTHTMLRDVLNEERIWQRHLH
jgi:CheY-like chemotaxis protein